MEAEFWHNRWKTKQIAFHTSEANPFLVKHFHALSLTKGERIFLPLCGKTLDISWLLSNGYRVVGAELSALAIDELFSELETEPTLTNFGNVKHYSAANIDIFVGDIFDLTPEMLGPVDAIYDRAALVALPTEMRIRYTSHLTKITNAAPQLLIQYSYDQNIFAGPPLSVSDDEIRQHYQGQYTITQLESTDVEGGLKGRYPAKENALLLQKNG